MFNNKANPKKNENQKKCSVYVYDKQVNVYVLVREKLRKYTCMFTHAGNVTTNQR